MLRGRIHALTGELAKAEADFQMAIELNPFNAEAYVQQSQLLAVENKLQEAEDFLTESLETLPDAAALYAERGRIRNLRGDKKGAFDDVKKSIELNPQGEMAQLCNGQHSNFDNLYKGGIF